MNKQQVQLQDSSEVYLAVGAPLASSAADERATLQQRMAGALTEVWSSKDGDRKRSLLFEKLPSRKEYPDYFSVIKRPIDLTAIAARVSAVTTARASSGLGYSKWQDFEDDMLRLFANAKLYNTEGSQIYADAEAMEDLFLNCSDRPCQLSKKHVFFSAETSFCYSSTTSSKASAKPSSEIDNKDTEIESAAAANLPRCARTDGRRWQCQQLVAGCGQRYCSKHSKHTRKKGKPVVKILSAFRGVAWDKKAQKWRAEITIVCI